MNRVFIRLIKTGHLNKWINFKASTKIDYYGYQLLKEYYTLNK